MPLFVVIVVILLQIIIERFLSWPIMLVAWEFKNTNLRMNTPKNGLLLYRIDQYTSKIVATLLFVVTEASLFDPGIVHLDGFDVMMIKIHQIWKFILSTTEIWISTYSILDLTKLVKEVKIWKEFLIQIHRKLNSLCTRRATYSVIMDQLSVLGRPRLSQNLFVLNFPIFVYFLA